MSYDEERQLQQFVQRTQQAIQLLFQQGFAAGVGANIHKGEKEAIRLGALAGLACLRGLDDANKEGAAQMDQNFEAIMERFFGESDKPKVEIAPASALAKNGKLIHN